MPDTPTSATMSLTESAQKRLAALREKEGNPALMLRVTVLGGGCSGFQYDLDLDDKMTADDVKFGDALVTDTMSLQFLNGAVVDYMQSIVKSAFKIRNPNEAAGCGCGKSFAPRM
ncbi:MAG TPA: iron-sulfur cluster assembly accessory protein [Patescibacteria group bacterium]|nr:iron-sulfur cluster assembly accessory protein [Patescibacteria group bacterium]